MSINSSFDFFSVHTTGLHETVAFSAIKRNHEVLEPGDTVHFSNISHDVGGFSVFKSFTCPVDGTYYIHLSVDNHVYDWNAFVRIQKQNLALAHLEISRDKNTKSASNSFVCHCVKDERIYVTVTNNSRIYGHDDGLLVTSFTGMLLNTQGKIANYVY